MKKNIIGISLLTLSGLYFLLAAIIIAVFMLTDLPISMGILVSIIVIIVQFLIAPWITDLTMKWFYKVNFNHDIPEYLKTFITE